MMKLKATTRSGFLTKTEEAKNRGSLRKRASPFDASLLFVHSNDLLVGKLLLIEDVGRDDETGVFSDLTFPFTLIERNSRHQMPDSFLRGGIFFRFASALIVCLAAAGEGGNEPRGFPFHCLFPCAFGILFARKGAHREMPELFLPLLLRFLGLLLHLLFCGDQACMRPHDDPPLFPLGQIHRACHIVSRPIAKRVPLLIHLLQGAFGSKRGFRHTRDAPDLCLIVALHIDLTVAATLKDHYLWLLPFGHVLTQVLP